MASVPGFGGILSALASRNYRLWTAGNSVSLIGTWIQRVAVGWLTWTLTGSGTWLGLVAFADLVPTFFVAPFGGAFADRLDRIKVVKIGQSLAMAQATVLWLLTAFDLITPEILVALTAFLGIVHSFGQPARLALISSLVKAENVPAAVAVNSIVFNTARFIGPAAAGVVIVYGGVATAFFCNAVSFAAFLYALTRIRIEGEEPRPRAERDLVSSLREGLVYAVRHAGIGPTLVIMAVVAVFGRPFVELFAGFADEVFRGGPEALAVLTSTVGLGAVAGAFVLSGRSDTRGFVAFSLVGAGLFGLAILGFTATDNLWVAVPAVAVAGACIVSIGISTQTLLQLAVEAGMRGRVLSLYGMIFRTGPGLGALIMGALSESLGLRWPVAGGAVIVVAMAAWTWRRRRHLQAALEPPGV